MKENPVYVPPKVSRLDEEKSVYGQEGQPGCETGSGALGSCYESGNAALGPCSDNGNTAGFGCDNGGGEDD